MDDERMKQEDVRQSFLKHDSNEWTSVYLSHHADNKDDIGISVALTLPEDRERHLESPYWSIDLGSNTPGFTQIYENGVPETKYTHSGNKERGIEPIVMIRTFDGTKPRVYEIAEEFRLFHNLWYDAPNNRYIKILADGSEVEVVKIRDNSWLDSEVKVRTKYLKQYQAARQRDMIIAISSVHQKGNLDDVDDNEVKEENWVDENINAKLSFNDSVVDGVSHYIATRIVKPWPVEKSGIWPYENTDEEYPDYIIGTDEFGENVYMGSSQMGEANYLKPIHFKKEVLKKYYDNPDLYSVEDGYIRCAGLWGLRMDNDHLDKVVVFLGDLGRDLPESERLHWKNYNILPEGGMSAAGFNRAFMAEFAEAEAPDTLFKHEYESFRTKWQAKFGWDLLKAMNGSDVNILKQVRIPLNNGDNEFEQAIDYLAKLIPESLNDKAIVKELGSKVEGEKSISKLERLLIQKGYPHIERDISFLRDLYDVRSKITAHRKGSDWEDALDKAFGEYRGQKAIMILLHKLRTILVDLTDFFDL